MRCLGCLRPNLTEAEFHHEYDGLTSLCKRCRSDRYYMNKYPLICSQCKKHRKLNQNNLCIKCNEEKGLRECRRCGKLLVAGLNFHGIRKTCTECRKTNHGSLS